MTRLKALLVVLLSAMMLTGCGFDVYKLPLPGGADAGERPLNLTIQFNDVLDLVPQSTVKVGDVSVGKVTDVRLDGYVAEIDVEVRRDADIPANAVAKIRQTSLLGEKFVSIEAPPEGRSADNIEDQAVIGLDRSGRNPEVEEVLSALSLLLNGGGVAQLNTISDELNAAFKGREGSARSVLRQLESFMGQLESNKGDIIHAIEAINRLSISVNVQMDTIDAALEQLPGALRSLDRQRDDLVKMLAALERLGNVGVRVIRASKAGTLESFKQLRPVLASLADAGDDLPYALQSFYAYPFIDEAVGKDPQVARNLHMGDYVNLSVRMDIDVAKLIQSPPGLPIEECKQLKDLGEVCGKVLTNLEKCLREQDARACTALPGAITEELCAHAPLPGVCPSRDGGTGEDDGTTNPLDKVLDELNLGGALGRAPTGHARVDKVRYGDLMKVYDEGLVALLVPGMVAQ